jgi:hypothetical protein
MVNAKYIITFLFLIILIPLVSIAQREKGFEMEHGEAAAKEAHKKDISPRIEMWNLDGLGAFQDSTKLDTLQDYFHIYHPVFKKVLTASYVGNYGTPYLNNDFFGRESNMNFFFLKSREAYLLMPATVDYFNTTTPYTRLDFTQSENKARKSEARLNVIHSQNVTPYLNFTFKWNQAKSVGQYNYQETKNNYVTLYSSYNKDEWSIHSGFIANSIKNMENGGLEDESSIFSPDDTEYLNVNLSNSRSHFSSTYFFTTAEYRVGKYEEINDSTEYFRPIGGLIYSVEYERHKQEFIEEEQFDSIFFDNTYYSDDYTKDSIRFNKLVNTIQLKQYENSKKKVTFGKRAFLGYEFIHGSTPGFTEAIENRQNIRYSNLFVGGGIFRQTGTFWTWNFDGKLYLFGRNAGQTELNGIISKPINLWGDSLAAFVVDGSIKNLVADPMQEKFYSNHIKWDNDFKMEQRMQVGGKFVSVKRKLDMGGRYEIINNFIYNDTLGIPTQTTNELVVFSLYFDKDFNYRNFHFRTRLLWQKPSSEKYIHLPVFSTFVSTYYKFVISKVMFAQVGVDTRYNTKYYADAYAPSTGLFYLQNEKKYGNFPYIDVYASFRLKRTRVFFKMMNIGSEFVNGEYITTPTYPMNKATFRFGVTWAFYD